MVFKMMIQEFKKLTMQIMYLDKYFQEFQSFRIMILMR